MEQTILFVNDSTSARNGETAQLKPYSLFHSDTYRNVQLTMIVAVGENLEIGKEGDLVWYIPADLKHFKEVTTGGAVIMGRKTWDSLKRKPLPNRLNIVVSRNADFAPEGAIKTSSIEEAIEAAKGSEAYIIGGESIYRCAMPYADRMEITHILASDNDADTYFPAFSMNEWEMIKESEIMETSDGLKYKFVTYRRKR